MTTTRPRPVPIRLACAALALGSAWVPEAAALHIDVAVALSGSTLVTSYCLPGTDGCDRLPVLAQLGLDPTVLPIDSQTGRQIFISDFGDFPGGAFRTDNPGFISGAGQLPANALLRYQASGALSYWDPATGLWTNSIPQGAQIRLFGGLQANQVFTSGPQCAPQLFCTITTFTESSTVFTGSGVSGASSLIVGTTNAQGVLHEHLDWYMELANGTAGGAVGAYMVTLSMTMTGTVGGQPIQASAPIQFMFNRGLSDADLGRAVASRIDLPDPPAPQVVPLPGALPLLGAALGGLARRRLAQRSGRGRDAA